MYRTMHAAFTQLPVNPPTIALTSKMHATPFYALAFGISMHNTGATPEGRAKTSNNSNKVKWLNKNEKDKLFK